MKASRSSFTLSLSVVHMHRGLCADAEPCGCSCRQMRMPVRSLQYCPGSRLQCPASKVTTGAVAVSDTTSKSHIPPAACPGTAHMMQSRPDLSAVKDQEMIS